MGGASTTGTSVTGTQRSRFSVNRTSAQDAILAVRDLPDNARERWKALFDHYVFDAGAGAHLPEGKRGILDRLTAETAGRLRAFLLRSLSR